MAQVPQKTLSWLWDVLNREYHDPPRTYSDLAQTLHKYSGFSPRTDVYTSENGAHALLAHLLGVLPVNFRGTPYRFPIEVWVPHAYPHEAPIIYVRPAADMMISPGQHVSGDGRVYHHYLAHWRKAWDRSNLVDFLSILADIFAKEPPVMSKQQQMQNPSYQQLTPPPRPPLPGEARQSPGHQQTRAGPPPHPPKETSNDHQRSMTFEHHPQSRYDKPPPLPPQPRAPGRPPSMHQSLPYGNGNVPQPGQPQYMPQRVNSLRQDQPQGQWQQQPQDHPSPSQSQIHQPQPQRQISQAYTQQPHLPYQQHNLALPQSQPKHQPAAPSLLDSPFDLPLPIQAANIPAPPIPRNPEKDALLTHLSSTLTGTLHSAISQNASALPALSSQHHALRSTLTALQSESDNLHTLQTHLTSNITLLQTSLTSATTTIASAHKRSAAGDIPKIDNMLIPPHVVGRQLYDTVSEERGIEAAMFALQEAFVRGRVGSDIWGRRMRELAREGFRKRWMERKVGRGMGLDMG